MSYLDGSSHFSRPGGRLPRTSRLIRAQLRDCRNVKFDILIRNVSEQGIGGIARGHILEQVENVTVLFKEDSMMEGTVAWIDGDRFGIKLANKLDVAVLSELVQKKQGMNQTESTWEVRRLHKVDAPKVGTLRRV